MEIDIQGVNVTVHEQPRGDYIVVLPLLNARGGILIDTEENREKPERGIVLVVGPGGIGPETGRDIPVISQLGQLVSHGKYAGQDFEIQSSKGPLRAIIMRDSEVLLYQEPGSFELTIHDEDPRKIHLAGLTCEHCQPEPSTYLEEERERLRRERAEAEAPSIVPVLDGGERAEEGGLPTASRSVAVEDVR